MSNHPTVSVPAPVSRRVANRTHAYANPAEDCSVACAEAMAWQDECEAMLRELAERVNATSNAMELRRLWRALHDVRHDVCRTCGMCPEDTQGRKFCPDCP